MNSNRIILAFLGLIILTVVILSSTRVKDAIRKRAEIQTQKQQIADAQISITPTSTPTIILANNQKQTATRTDYKNSEIPSTGPEVISYLFLSGGLITGLILKKIKD